MKIKDYILISITTLAFLYMVGYIFLIPIFRNSSIGGWVVWCLCGIWILTFMLANYVDN